MRINVLVFLPGPHRLPFESEWPGDVLPTPSEVVAAMRDGRLVGPDGARVEWTDAHAVLVMPSGGGVPSAIKSVACSRCRRGTVVLAPEATESGVVKWSGSCPRCGESVLIDERDL